MSPTEDAVKAASKVDMPVLEGLRLALGSLRDPERRWDFGEWQSCTCGHIYAGAHGGKMAATATRVWRDSPRTRYGRMLRAIIDGNGLPPAGGYSGQPYVVVSDETFRLAKRRSGRRAPSERSLRNAAIVLVQNAVEHVEAQQREAMRRVTA